MANIPVNWSTCRAFRRVRLPFNTWLAEHQATLEGSYFYSDSHNDLPLLEQVSHPVAVDPDDTLRALAVQRGWTVMTLRD